MIFFTSHASSLIIALYKFDRMSFIDFSYYSYVSWMSLDSLQELIVLFGEFFQIHDGL